MKKGRDRMVTAKEFSELRGIPSWTLRRWLQRGIITGVEKKPDPFKTNAIYYLIPLNAEVPPVKRGRPKKKPTKKKSKNAN
jgi:hypothetical protein